jgi:hypothetical protein
VSDEPESWVAKLGPDGQIVEYRHFWSASAGAGVTPFTMQVGQHISVGLLVGGGLRSRSTNAVVDSVDSDTPVGTFTGVLLSLDRTTLAQRWGMTAGGEALLSRVRAGAGGELVLSGYFEDRFEPSPANGNVIATEDFSRHGLLLAGVDALGDGEGIFLRLKRGPLESLVPLVHFEAGQEARVVNRRTASPAQVAASPSGAVYVGGYLEGVAAVGRHARVDTLPAVVSAYLLRVNSDNGLLCSD